MTKFDDYIFNEFVTDAVGADVGEDETAEPAGPRIDFAAFELCVPEPEDEPEEEEEEEEDDEGGSEQFEQESVVESSAVTTVAEVKPEDYDAIAERLGVEASMVLLAIEDTGDERVPSHCCRAGCQLRGRRVRAVVRVLRVEHASIWLCGVGDGDGAVPDPLSK